MSRVRIPSRCANRLERAPFRCRLLGHRWPDQWGDNGCYTVHEEEEPGAEPEHWHLFTRWCTRCGKLMSKLEQRPLGVR